MSARQELKVPRNEEHQRQLLTEHEGICNQTIKEDNATTISGSSCPAVWDGMLCWRRAGANTTHSQPCPHYVLGVHAQENATKMCNANGTWLIGKETLPWTNFTLCFPPPGATVLHPVVVPGISATNESNFEPYLTPLKIIAEVGYSVSLGFLIAAFLILACFRRLRCPRNQLHMHLFASFILRAAMALLKHYTFIDGLGLSSSLLQNTEGYFFHHEPQNTWPCRAIISLWQYFIMANYCLILMEGLYLNNLIFLALFHDSSPIRLYVAIGWGLPTLFVLAWVLCKLYLENTWCWTINDNTKIFLLIRVPIIASIVVNFVLFVNIVRVLFSKIKASICEESQTYRRWAKSTLVLVPLFGIHYMIFLCISFSSNEIVEIVWLFCDQLFASFNGFFVALLYCFLNGEVRAEISKIWTVYVNQHEVKSNFLSTRNDSSQGNGHIHSSSRHEHPRGSCVSNTSCTSVCAMNAHRNRKRHPPALTPGNEKDCAITVDENQPANLENSENEEQCPTSEFDVKCNSIELKNITKRRDLSEKT